MDALGRVEGDGGPPEGARQALGQGGGVFLAGEVEVVGGAPEAGVPQGPADEVEGGPGGGGGGLERGRRSGREADSQTWAFLLSSSCLRSSRLSTFCRAFLGSESTSSRSRGRL